MNVDPIARWYRFIEHLVFGGALEVHRFAFLDRLACARRILVLGEGDGRAIAKLLVAAPHAHIDVFELSGKMIQLARERLGKEFIRVSFHQQDAVTASWPDEHYDGVITHFFLDCFTEDPLHGLVQRIAAVMTPDALWLVADFAIPERGWRRHYATILIRIMYEFFSLTTGLDVHTLPRIGQILARAGLRRVAHLVDRSGMIRSEVWTRRAPETLT